MLEGRVMGSKRRCSGLNGVAQEQAEGLTENTRPEISTTTDKTHDKAALRSAGKLWIIGTLLGQ